MRLHIHACPDCLARVIERDALQIFAPLAEEDQGQEFWAGFWPAVRADIHAAEAERGSWRSWLARPAVAWGTAAALLIVAAVASLRPWQHGPSEGPAVPVAQVSPGGWHEVLPSSGAVGEPSVPTLEEVRSPSAEVLSVKVYGADQAETEVVLIVDEEIHL